MGRRHWACRLLPATAAAAASACRRRPAPTAAGPAAPQVVFPLDGQEHVVHSLRSFKEAHTVLLCLMSEPPGLPRCSRACCPHAGAPLPSTNPLPADWALR